MDKRMKYIVALGFAAAFMASAYYYPAETFLAATVGWLFIIPAAFVVYLIHGYIVYMSERKHRIEVTMKPTEAMKALARREMELQREKEVLLFQQSR